MILYAQGTKKGFYKLPACPGLLGIQQVTALTPGTLGIDEHLVFSDFSYIWNKCNTFPIARLQCYFWRNKAQFVIPHSSFLSSRPLQLVGRPSLSSIWPRVILDNIRGDHWPEFFTEQSSADRLHNHGNITDYSPTPTF